MQRLGFIHDMMDVKVLLLLVLSRCNYPVSTQEAYELCYQDDCLSYFDVCTALPEMVKSGHIHQVEGEKYDLEWGLPGPRLSCRPDDARRKDESRNQSACTGISENLARPL